MCELMKDSGNIMEQKKWKRWTSEVKINVTDITLYVYSDSNLMLV